MSELKDRMNVDVKAALKAGDKLKTTTLRGMLAALKQVEVDSRVVLDEPTIIGILTKLTNQRRDSIAQFDAAQRTDLADKERAELKIIEAFLPSPLSPDEIEALIAESIKSTEASQIKDMGKVMNVLRPQLIGRTDIAVVSAIVKSRLTGG